MSNSKKHDTLLNRKNRAYQYMIALAQAEGISIPVRNNEQAGKEFDEWQKRKIKEMK